MCVSVVSTTDSFEQRPVRGQRPRYCFSHHHSKNHLTPPAHLGIVVIEATRLIFSTLVSAMRGHEESNLLARFWRPSRSRCLTPSKNHCNGNASLSAYLSEHMFMACALQSKNRWCTLSLNHLRGFFAFHGIRFPREAIDSVSY